jgi:poly(A) polymerase
MQHLSHQPWMTRPETASVFDALEAAGGSDCARFVGGCVRDAIMGRTVGDIDIATTLEPEAVIAALKAARLGFAPKGLAHGTVTAISNHAPHEITTLRRDVSTDGRRASVAFTTDWAEDAARRDFTINALYAARDGTLHDPTGRGLEDARAGRVVFVGEPDRRLAEDHLRSLRFFRFVAVLGRGEPDPEALAACARAKDGIEALSGERVRAEMLKLLAADDPRTAVARMAEAGVLPKVLKAEADLARFDALVEIEADQLFECEPLLRLAALIGADATAAARLAQRLRLSNAEKARLLAAIDPVPVLKSWMSPREIRREIHRIGQPVFRDRAKLAWAASPRTATTMQWRGLVALSQGWTPPPFPLTGADVVKAGVPEGPLVGKVMAEVEAWWIDHDFLDDKFSAIEKLKAVAQGMVY